MRNIQLILNAILSKNVFEYILVDKDLCVLSASDGIEKYTGESPKKGEDVLEYLPEFVGNEDEIKQIFIKKYCLYSLEAIYKNDYYVNITVEYCDNATAIVLLHNITAATYANQRLLQYSNESTLLYNTLQKVLDNQNALVFVTDFNEIQFVNQKFLDYFNVDSMDDVKEKRLDLFKNFDTSLISYDALFDLVKDREEYFKINADTFILKSTLIESTHKLFTLTKVTKLSKKTEVDSLTGAYRKSYFDEYFEKLNKDNFEFSLAVLDVDRFKEVNDNYGHQTGDRVLQELARLVKDQIRHTDLFVRWGGEEFVLLFEGADLEQAHQKANEIREVIEKHLFDDIGHLTVSIGLAQYKTTDTKESIFHRADQALYQAKSNGRNKVVVNSQ